MPTNQQQSKPRPLKLLFVDDEPFAVEYFVEDLRNDNMEISFCRSAKAAQEMFRQESFDVAIFDVMMHAGPYEDKVADGLATGLYLLRDFRAQHSKTPVIVLTNSTAEKTLTEIQAEPFVKVLAKVKILPSEFPGVVRAFAEGAKT